ncbi:transglutaminase family protein [Microbacterium sp. NPDC077184]|uniref:transglutaminase family protein n=1 Tax=Microbacterium sp. NPDC077184 TaxID=3154764 RepID=UPI003424F13C
MRYRVIHRTSYEYDADVSDSFGIAHVVPRELPWQQVHSRGVEIEPVPADTTDDVDGYGNLSTYYHVTEAHRRLGVNAESVVTVLAPAYDPAALAQSWEAARPLVHRDLPDAWAAAEFVVESPKAQHAAAARKYAAASFLPGRAIGDAVVDLTHRIFRDFRYDGKATTVTSTVGDVLAARAGVCQDFAHLALACLRSHGLAARYVSGYLATQPPPGKERVFGADASHAWLAVWLPLSGEWLAVDPTNDQVVGDRHVTTAWGRDYGDVAPVKGVIFTEAKRSTLRVAVDVAPLESAVV